MNKSTMAPAILILLLLVLAGPTMGEDSFEAFGLTRPATRVPAPPFTLKGLDGEETNLEGLKGRLVVLNFWATWCEPCRVEMPSLARLSGKFQGKGLIVIAVAGDRGLFARKNVKKFLAQYPLEFPVLIDPEGAVRKTYEVVYLPTTYIIGRDGLIIGKVTGERIWDGKEAREFFNAVLEE
ncbi:MAG: TlpA disulfide reductase family protein [Thermodesulfobacteriota bacterium]